MEKQRLIAVVGPTASGKTSLGVSLCLALGGEVVSADSMQIYKNMPIAAAVPTDEEKRGVPHHLIEICEPDEAFSVYDYVNLAKTAISNIASRGKLPVLVGGTGLYVNSLLDGTVFSPAGEDEALRKKLSEEYDSLGGDEMLSRLARFDPASAAALSPNDKKRVLRAIEIYELTGVTKSEHAARSKAAEPPYNAAVLGIDFRDRAALYERIDRRVDEMLDRGLLDEARRFDDRFKKTAAQAIGHKELYPFIHGECSLFDAAESLKRATRRYAKRQLTWFRRDERIRWLFADEQPD